MRPISLLAIALWMPSAAGAAQTADAVMLSPGLVLERDIGGAELHRYNVTLDAGDHARIVVRQLGIDLAVQLVGVDGALVVEFDRALRTYDEEPVEIVADARGTYQLTLKARYARLPAGRYEIRFAELRGVSLDDRSRDEARRLVGRSLRLSDGGKYQEALLAAEEALRVGERVWSSDDLELAIALLAHARNLFLVGDYARAEASCRRAVAIAERALGPDHPYVGRLLYNHGVFTAAQGQDAAAERLFEMALPVQESALGPDHPHIAHTVNRLARLCANRGDWVCAERLLHRALAVSEKSIGPESDDAALSINALAGVYRAKGDFVSAEPLYRRALALYESTRGATHPTVAAPLNNLGNLYRDMGQYDDAEAFYQRSIAIKANSAGTDHPDVAQSRIMVAGLYHLRGDFARAEPMYRSALAVLVNAIGISHPLVAWYEGKLAGLYVSLGEDATAEPLYRRAATNLEAAYGADSPYLAEILAGLAGVAARAGQVEQALFLQARVNTIAARSLALNLANGSERQKLAFVTQVAEQLDRAIALHVRFAPDDEAAVDLAASALLQRKGRVQDAMSDSLAAIRNRFDPSDRALLDQWQALSSQLARVVLLEAPALSPAEHRKQIEALEAQRERLEAGIEARSAAFRVQSQPATLAAIRAAIPDDAALIEFGIYRPLESNAPAGAAGRAPRYVAYVLRSRGPVRWAELGAVAEIDSAVTAWREALRDPRRRDTRRLARRVAEKVMQPLRPLTSDAAHLLISPDGALNLMPFEALVDASDRYLVERHAITYLTSGRDLVRPSLPREAVSKPTLIANPLFGEPENAPAAQVASPARPVARRTVTVAEDLTEVYFAPLAGTAQEARAIRAIYPDAELLVGAAATESAFKGVAAPVILHIATHGFFLEDADSKATTNPLVRSGLALAGANRRQGSPEDDGIVTALEASGLNLWGTKLVVLSACDTGLGDVRNGEGVYGLRRAFTLAGAESVVMSLWPVNDYATRQLMTSYHENLSQGLGRGAALRRVQLEMLEKNNQLHPFYWANFIHSGEWASLDGVGK